VHGRPGREVLPVTRHGLRRFALAEQRPDRAPQLSNPLPSSGRSCKSRMVYGRNWVPCGDVRARMTSSGGLAVPAFTVSRRVTRHHYLSATSGMSPAWAPGPPAGKAARPRSVPGRCLRPDAGGTCGW
jgi:hypothetical protein